MHPVIMQDIVAVEVLVQVVGIVTAIDPDMVVVDDMEEVVAVLIVILVEAMLQSKEILDKDTDVVGIIDVVVDC